MKNKELFLSCLLSLAVSLSVWVPDIIAGKPQPKLKPWLPISTLTPGVVDTSVTSEDLDNPEFIKESRNVTQATKDKIYKKYGLDPAKVHFEVDHRVPLCLGGKNCELNLWPEPWYYDVDGRDVGAHRKDVLEVKLHRLVKSGKMPLDEAQAVFLGDWTQGYREYIGDFPLTKDDPETEPDPGASPDATLPEEGHVSIDTDVRNPW